MVCVSAGAQSRDRYCANPDGGNVNGAVSSVGGRGDMGLCFSETVSPMSQSLNE